MNNDWNELMKIFIYFVIADYLLRLSHELFVLLFLLYLVS